MSFDALAPDYDRLRSGGGWQEVTERSLALLAGATRLIDVGCGTGRFAVLAHERLGCRVWGIDSSPGMLEQARARPGAASIGWRSARAERLPFRAGWFDAAHLHLVLHLVDDRAAALAELGRVLAAGGRVVIATFELDHFGVFHLAPYFPSIERNDRARFPDPDAVVTELTAAGFEQVERIRVSTRVEVEPATVLERVRARYISSLSELDEREYRDGLERLEREVLAGAGPALQRAEWCLISGRRG